METPLPGGCVQRRTGITGKGTDNLQRRRWGKTNTVLLNALSTKGLLERIRAAALSMKTVGFTSNLWAAPFLGHLGNLVRWSPNASRPLGHKWVADE